MPYLSVSQRDGVTMLAADRPPANAMNLELLLELGDTLERLGEDPPAALVVAGRPGFFSAGADLKAIPGYGPDEQRQMVEQINRMVLVTYELPCPVIGAITGHAIAGGMVFALCTDYRIASSEGSYGLTEVKVGVPYPQAAIGVVKAELAPHAARMLAFSNRLVSADECRRLGVFDEVLAPQDVIGRAHEVARAMSAFPVEAYARTKHDLRDAALERMRDAAASDPLLEAWVAGN